MCEHTLRDGQCALDDGHKGRHTTVAFYCDGCGRMRGGYPHARSINPFDGRSDADLCFLCCRGLT